MYRAFNTLGISCNWILHAPRMSFRRYCKNKFFELTKTFCFNVKETEL
jgi:hypothetical protein